MHHFLRRVPRRRVHAAAGGAYGLAAVAVPVVRLAAAHARADLVRGYAEALRDNLRGALVSPVPVAGPGGWVVPVGQV